MLGDVASNTCLGPTVACGVDASIGSEVSVGSSGCDASVRGCRVPIGMGGADGNGNCTTGC